MADASLIRVTCYELKLRSVAGAIKMEFPWGSLIGGLIAIVALVIGNRLTYARSSKEKIWDLRRVAYGQIISELGAIERVFNDANEYISERDYNEYWESKARVEHDAEIAKHMATITDRFSDDYLILSDKFIKAFTTFISETTKNNPNLLAPEEHEIFSEAVHKYRPLLTALAREEMNIKS